MFRIPGLCIKLLLCISVFSGQLNAEPVVRVLDVAEGQAVLIQNQEKALLIDTGHAGLAQHVVEKVVDYGVSQLLGMVLTHLHPDHASGYFRLREAYLDTPVYTSCHPLVATVSPDMTRWVYEALQKDRLHRCIKAGDQLSFPAVNISVLWPEKFVNGNLNMHSLVLLVEHGKRRTLIMGDAGFVAEESIISQKLVDKVDYLVVGHHGASDATGELFLTAIQPDVAVISVNKQNIRGYPSEDVIKLLESRGVRVMQTDKLGDIQLR